MDRCPVLAIRERISLPLQKGNTTGEHISLQLYFCTEASLTTYNFNMLCLVIKCGLVAFAKSAVRLKKVE